MDTTVFTGAIPKVTMFGLVAHSIGLSSDSMPIFSKFSLRLNSQITVTPDLAGLLTKGFLFFVMEFHERLTHY